MNLRTQLKTYRNSFLFIILLFTIINLNSQTIDCQCPEAGEFPVGSIVPDIINGEFSDSDFSTNLDELCWDFGTIDQEPDEGFHKYDVYQVHVTETGSYTFAGSDNNSKLLIGIFDNEFHRTNSCNGIIGGMGGYIPGYTYEEPTNGGVIDNAIDLEVGVDYTIVISDFDANYLGSYEFNIISQGSGEIIFSKKAYGDECEYFGCFEDGVDYSFLLPDYDSSTSTLTWIETVQDGPSCGTSIVNRIYTIDFMGNQSSCTSEYFFYGDDLSQLEWPLNWDGTPSNNPIIDCNSDFANNPIPDNTGVPAGYNEACGTIEIFYYDNEFDLDDGKKILRHWTIVDDCTGAIYEHIQIIRIFNDDNIPPSFTKPDDLVVKTNAYVCNADVEIPKIFDLKDLCDPSPKWWISSSIGTMTGDDNSNGFVDIQETWELLNVPLGDYDLCYHAIDIGKNEIEICINLKIIDRMKPISVCEQFKQVTISALGNAMVWAKEFDSGSFDNCNLVYFKAMRVTDSLINDGGCSSLNGDDLPQTDSIDIWYDDNVFFCCEDLDSEIMVTMRVFDTNPGIGPINPSRFKQDGDLYGHYNDCWSIVNVECKIQPALNCPPITVSCDESLNPYENPDIIPNIISVCGYDLEYTDKNEGVCTPNIIRTWTVTGCNKSTQCKQKITLDSIKSFDPCTIVFPKDTNTYCNSELIKPKWDESSCQFVTAEIINEDTFKFVDGGCIKIIREWAVIDWCVYEINDPEENVDVIVGNKLDCSQLVEDGYYRYTQILKINDFTIPEIIVEKQCVAITDCFAYDVKMEAFASDSCNTTKKFNWKYIVTNMDNLEIIQYSYNYVPIPDQGTEGKRTKDDLDSVAVGKLVILDPLPIGSYRVTWTVGDGCGNVSSKNQYFDVADKKAPLPIMVDIATAVMVNEMVELNARTFDKGGCDFGCLSSVDNCTDKTGLFFTFTDQIPNLWDDQLKWAKQLAKYGRYFFDPTNGVISTEDKYFGGTAHAWLPQGNTSRQVFICNVNDILSERIIKVYVWDKFAYNQDCDDNNFDFANIFIKFNCEAPNNNIFGNIKVVNSNRNFTGMHMLAENDMNTRTTISENGEYSFFLNHGVFQISGTNDENPLNGVSTMDKIIILKHLLGIEKIQDPLKLIAADVNRDQRITTLDVVRISQVLLRKEQSFENNSWVAISNDYSFEYPGRAEKEADKARVREINTNGDIIKDLDFTAIKIGDVDNTINTGWTDRESNNISLLIDDKELEKGDIIEIPFYAKNFSNIFGAQFTMNIPDLTIENIYPGVLPIGLHNLNTINNSFVFSWHDLNENTVNEDDVLFTLVVKANADLKLSTTLNLNDDILRTEVYKGSDLKVNHLSLQFRNPDLNQENNYTRYMLHQNKPNPFFKSTIIGFDLPIVTNYKLTIYDITGKVLKVFSNTGKEGYNKIVFDKTEISTTGLLLYKLETANFVDIKKMIVF